MNIFQTAITILILAIFITPNGGNVGIGTTAPTDNTFGNNSIIGNSTDGCPGCTGVGPGN